MIVEVAPVVELTATFFAFKRSFSCKIQGDFKQLATESRKLRFIAQTDMSFVRQRHAQRAKK